MNYEDRIVLFLDILGFKKIIEETFVKGNDGVKIENFEKTKLLIDTIREMKQSAKLSPKETSKNVTQFSDSIVISFKENDTKEIPKLFHNLQNLISNLLYKGFLCRGAISYGKLYHQDDLIFGPALVDAYETESKAALYPRVILDKSVLEVMKYHYTLENRHSYRKIIFNNKIESYLKTDTDDKFYIDYFTGSMIFYKDKELFDFHKRLKLQIIYGMRSPIPNVNIKYSWMCNKFNKIPETLSIINNEAEVFLNRPDIKKLYDNFKPIKTTANKG